MRRGTHLLLGILCVSLLAVTTYQFAPADDRGAHDTGNLTPFADVYCLVVFDLGADGVDRTVLFDASIMNIDSKRFLSGVLSDKYPSFRVISPGNAAYIPFDRIAYIQILEGPKAKDAG